MFNIAGNSSGGYNLTNSLRFRSSASAYLSRTPATAGTRTTWTWSGWVKRGALTSLQMIFSAGTSGSSAGLVVLQFSASDTLQFVVDTGTTSYQLNTTQVFRDPSAWYHIVAVLDTTQATSTNRMKLYLNGSQITAFGTATYPAQNDTYAVNNTQSHNIGRYYFDGTRFLDGYLTEINFVDGQALTPSSFGSTDSATGQWLPKKYTGTYGTNGYYLNFVDNSALTTTTNVGLGKDNSGNGNYWATNNISITAGTTYDSMKDVPTNTSATAGNYAVWNPLAKSSAVTLSNGNLTATGSAITNNRPFTATQKVFNKCYWETQITTVGGSSTRAPIGTVQIPFNPATFADDTLQAITGSSGLDTVQLDPGGIGGSAPAVYQNGSNVLTLTGLTHTANDIYMFAYDSGKLWIGKNGTWYNSGNPAAGTGAIVSNMTGEAVPIGFCYGATVWQFNGGQRAFSYTPPSSFVGFNTYNLPDATIKQGNKYMDATTYTGTGASNAITNAGAFKPDLVWIKGRSGATDHALYDFVRGTTKDLVSNSTAAETTQATGLTSFGTSGFTVGALAKLNTSTATYVGWQWQAGQGTTSSNTSGSITSTVSVNATAGFSVVTWSGSGANATIGHGLGVAPKMILTFFRSGSGTHDRKVYHSSIGATNFLYLSTTAASAASSTVWNNTAPTSTVFSVGTDNDVNASGNTYVAYCWAEIAGFSKFGSYTGNGSTDGTFVYTGFRPKFILIKASSQAGNDWQITDTSRSTYNAAAAYLYPDLTNAEGGGSFPLDLLSNGFKLRSTTGDNNNSGVTFIYAAFAENPFKNSNAR